MNLLVCVCGYMSAIVSTMSDDAYNNYNSRFKTQKTLLIPEENDLLTN